jgi:hypothetical protein
MSYMAMHNRLRRIRGSATLYTCSCGEPAKEWAYSNSSPYERIDDQGRRYSIRLEDYTPQCFHCHRVEDKSAITHCPQGHPYDGENLLIDQGKRKCKVCVYERNTRRRRANPMTDLQKERKLELQRQRRAQERTGRHV